ncbi:DUF551 domain-containing protein [Klebsiella quasipneumoniae]|uniref:DUF551 domain-containing protein n=1 Tax=Klebsiella quasipneumoniae TaxID=1463165 RepID=UPI002DB91C8C|nr:DUF551 domain-containing protein [Klebsiella quasipneumoniae]MEB6481818.1 DUF551 domain-containing protein [Klebsiella quasipneumoniae]
MKEELLLLRNQLKMGHRISFAEAMLLQRAIDILVNKAGNSPAQSDCCPAQNQGWISVSERLPDEGDHVLVSDGVGMEVSWIRGREWKKLRHIYSEDVTHWMPLPAAPQEVKGE